MPLNYRKNNVTYSIQYYDTIQELHLFEVLQNNRINVQVNGSTKYIGIVPVNNQQASDLRVSIGGNTYALAKVSSANNITISSDTTYSLYGTIGVVYNLTINNGVTLTTRANAYGDVSPLEVYGNLTLNGTLNLIRSPLIVHGNITGNGTIISPDGADGGSGGVGGTGGTGGTGGSAGESFANEGSPGGSAPSNWVNKEYSLGSSMSIEYLNILAGSGGNGGQGTSGGGGSGGASYSFFGLKVAGGGGNSGIYLGSTSDMSIPRSGAGAGAGGNASGITKGIGATGSSGESGLPASTNLENIAYTGLGFNSNPSVGSSGTFGGEGADGVSASFSSFTPGNNGSNGGSGGAGGGGGALGGSSISVWCKGSISSGVTIRTGKGGRTGSSNSLNKAQSGNLWLFSSYISNPTPFTIDTNGRTPSPLGANGTIYLYPASGTELNSFLNSFVSYYGRVRTILT